MRFFLLLLGFVFVGKAIACSCASHDPLTRESVAKLKGAYRGVIVGKIVEDSALNVTYRLLIKERYVGMKTDTIEFKALSESGLCGIDTNIGSEWIITWDKDVDVPKLSICSRVYDLSELRRYIKYFRFRYGNGQHRMMRKIVHATRREERFLSRHRRSPEE